MGEESRPTGPPAAAAADSRGIRTKYVWISIKQTQNDNLTSDPPSALLRNTVIADYSIRTETEPTVE
jgi:hypothetical protein